MLGEGASRRTATRDGGNSKAMMEERRARETNPADWRAVRRGWFLGDAQFKKELLAQMHESFGAHHGGEEREESCAALAERLLESELKRPGWTKEQLANRRKGDARKARVAQRLREETTMTLAWIADQLSMGSASTVAQSLKY